MLLKKTHELQAHIYTIETELSDVKKNLKEEKVNWENKNVTLQCQIKIANSERFSYEASYLMMKEKMEKLE